MYQKRNSHKEWEALEANAVGSRSKWEVHTCKERVRRSTTKQSSNSGSSKMVSADRIDSHKLKKLVTAVGGSEEKAAKKSGVQQPG